MLTLESCRARIAFHFPAKKQAAAVMSALKADLKSSRQDQASVKLALESSTLFLEITSPDLPSLRAGINSLVRLVDTCFGCLNA